MIRLKLRHKILISFMMLALIPLGILAAYSANNLREIERFLSDHAKKALDEQAGRALVLRAQMVAREVSSFLEAVEGDVRDLSLLPPSADAYIRFTDTHRSPVWYRKGTLQRYAEVREDIPLFSELAFLSSAGRELVRIVKGKPSSELRDVSRPESTTYLSEDYFAKAVALPKGEVYVSRLSGWHVNRAYDFANPEAVPVEESRYSGVIRFALAVRSSDGQLKGVVVASLDHRHLSEFSQHITPTENQFTVFPKYESGNYAFLFDDEGWIITHPKYWDIRGYDKTGKLVPPYTENSSPDAVKRGDIPYNLLHAGFIHQNYPAVAQDVLDGRAGVADVTNVGGAQKIMAYAPIFYKGGEYARSGIFGGVTIGAEVGLFHQPAVAISSVIKKEMAQFISNSWILIIITTGAILLVGFRISLGVTRPLSRLIDSTQEMARSGRAPEVTVPSRDEVGQLADSFNAMTHELELRQNRLESSLAALSRSREEIIRERNFKTTLFEQIETGIITLDESDRVTSLNTPVKQILHLPDAEPETPLTALLAGQPEVVALLTPALASPERWSSYLDILHRGQQKRLRFALIPIMAEDTKGRILTVEDLTERVKMREQMARMERLASMGKLSAGLAHEIRNPLTGMSIMLDDLHDRLLKQPEDQTMIQKALMEIERLEGLVTELLSYAGAAHSSLRSEDISPMLRDTLFFVKKQCERSGIALVADIPESLPPLPADVNKLKQAVLNLLTNAMDAMPDGGTLTLTAKVAEGSIHITVADTGDGVPADQAEAIFEPFYTTKGGGTGLGLAITHNIVVDHGGRIEVATLPDRGAVLTIILPLISA